MKNSNTIDYQNASCPCGSDMIYSACCARYLEKGELPASPEILMRSRYTAFTQGDADYIGKTMKDEALQDYSAAATKQWAQSVKWQGLEIKEAPEVPEGDTTGYVHFIANYISENKAQATNELSEFTKIEGRWYYTRTLAYDPLPGDEEEQVPFVRAENERVGRNDPCLCGSGKKFKKCCAA